MRSIRKAPQPRTVTEIATAETTHLGTSANARTAFDQLDKAAVRQSLAMEQEHLCCFCMRAIDNGAVDGNGVPTMRIAHRIPIDADASLALTWQNLLGSCDGGQSAKRVRTCDAAQGNKRLTIDPTRPAIQAQISYERKEPGKGLLMGSPNADIVRDVATLNLNGGDLPDLRGAAWEGFQAALKKEHPTNHWQAEIRRRFYQSWASGPNGRRREYCGVVESKRPEVLAEG